MEHKLIVAGIGPGHQDYILPCVLKAMENAKVLAGGRRALDGLAKTGQHLITIGGDLTHAIAEITEKLQQADVVVLVSGDPGFHSLLVRLKKEFPQRKIEVLPGISSLQMAFSRLALPWQEAKFLSMHNKEQPLEVLSYKKGRKLGLLTDNKNNPAAIAKKLKDAGWPENSKCYVCANLSYDDEVIESFNLAEMLSCGNYNNCVVVVTD